MRTHTRPRVTWCLDLSQVSSDRVDEAAAESGLLIYEILGRAGVPDDAQVPDKATVEKEELRAWTVPQTQISIVRVEEGDRAGEFLFNPQTVASAPEFYEKVKSLPHIAEFPPGIYEAFISRPALGLPYLWVDALPSWTKQIYLRNPVWKWFGIIIVVTVGVTTVLLVFRMRRLWDLTYGRRGGYWRIGTLMLAISLVVIPLGMEYILDEVLHINFEVAAVLEIVLHALGLVAAVFALLALFGFVAEVVISSRQLKEKSINAHLVRVITRILFVIVSIYIVIEASEYLGLPLTPALAGLGIGGLAVALAARPTLENIIGGFILFSDKPVRVGDFCRYGEDPSTGWLRIGTVEEIGLRSTRIRGIDRTITTIPNAEFSKTHIVNLTQRDQRLLMTTLQLRYETTPEQLRYILAKLRELLLGHPMVTPDPARVRFLGYGSYSEDVGIFAYLRCQDENTFLAIREDIFLRVEDIIGEAGTAFAVPSQTAYLTRDTGLDAERRDKVEARVESWRARGKFPFPEFEEEERERLEDILDYPPKGSPDYSPRTSLSAPKPRKKAVH